jgi:hypothetical protein
MKNVYRAVDEESDIYANGPESFTTYRSRLRRFKQASPVLDTALSFGIKHADSVFCGDGLFYYSAYDPVVANARLKLQVKCLPIDAVKVATPNLMDRARACTSNTPHFDATYTP